MSVKRRAYYVLSTHWDREWYQTFQDFRYRLVQVLDHVLDGLADGRLKGPFQTDGQAILIEDYLEVRPERSQQVRQFAREGKLVIGPWYGLPDLFLVSGESLIRNLRLGRQTARNCGGRPSNAGFLCDMFGHNSQIPQILAGFGIRGAFIWRGTNNIDKRHLRWRGADGTEILCYRFGCYGYTDFARRVRHADQRNRQFDRQTAEEDLEKFIADEAERSQVSAILMFDGADHLGWDQQVYSVLARRMADTRAEIQIVHGSLDDYLQQMQQESDKITDCLVGELREPGLEALNENSQYLIPGVLSSRVWIKQANAECQTLLCQWAEPLAAFVHLALGDDFSRGFLDVAWKWLLKNHPHDSICGCSIDAVHEDMKFRFHQCRGIADRVFVESARKLAAAVEGPIGDDELRVAIFNPLAQPVEQTTELTLEIPADWPTFEEFFGFEPKPAFRIYDPQNNEIAYQRLSQRKDQRRLRTYENSFPEDRKVHEVTISVPVSIPAMGYTTLTVRRGQQDLPTRHPQAPGLATSERSMANEYLSVLIESNGTITLTDKRSDQTYRGLLTFEDCADIGDGWYHGPAVNDQMFASCACRSDVALVHDGPMQTTFRIRTAMAVPVRFEFDRMVRSEQFTDLLIDSLVTLRPGCDRVEVQTTVQNTADDHRLRVLLPTGADADTYLADSPFDVVRRPIALRKDNHLYRELEVETKPQQTWTAVFDAHRGLAVVSTGLMESAVRDLPDRPIALTLFRSTQRTVMTSGEPKGQLRGGMTFRYWIMPLDGPPDRAALCRAGQLLAAGLRDVQLNSLDLKKYRSAEKLPASAGWFRIEGPAVVSSFRQVDHALELRLFNPEDQAAVCTVRFDDFTKLATAAPTKAQLVDFESNPLETPKPIEKDAFELALGPKKILTVRLT